MSSNSSAGEALADLFDHADLAEVAAWVHFSDPLGVVKRECCGSWRMRVMRA
jgi:hypothetical protein